MAETYIGAMSEVPIYEEKVTKTPFSFENFALFFDTGTDSGYSLSNNKNWAMSNNSTNSVKIKPNNFGIDSSVANVKYTAKRDIELTITGAYYTESNYDKITLKVGSTVVLNAVSGTQASKTFWTGTLSAGQSLTFFYTKDSSSSASNESSTNFIITSDTNIVETEIIQTGVEEKEVARKVAKMYISVDGVAREIKKGYLGVEGELPRIYGVSWDKSSSTILARTDLAENFDNPKPAIAGGEGSSPFDDIYPWNEMVKETINGNELVKIPKFYYKWTDTENELKLQISDKYIAGFHISPSHADRGDGQGERDYIYIGRYHCNSSYKSKSGNIPIVNMTLQNARTNIMQKQGANYHLCDYAMFWTVRMLYLVEYASWDVQDAIGAGCGNNSSIIANGATDSMNYHTGTVANSKSSYGMVQYRYIENLWANTMEWCDGIRFNTAKIYAYNNINEYADTTAGTLIGMTPTNTANACVSGWGVPTEKGFEWALYPSATNGTDYTKYITDQYHYLSTSISTYTGAYYKQGPQYGMFMWGEGGASGKTSEYVGARIQYLPPNDNITQPDNPPEENNKAELDYTGAYETEDVTISNINYTMYKLIKSGTLTIEGDTTGMRVWMCNGGNHGSRGYTNGSGCGGGGGCAASSDAIEPGTYAVTIGSGGTDVLGGQTKFGSLAPREQTGDIYVATFGGSGGGGRYMDYGSVTNFGSGQGNAAIPFGALRDGYCAGGGGGACYDTEVYEGGIIGYGGAGGTLGGSGGSRESGEGGVKGGGCGANSSGKNSACNGSFYGAGGGGAVCLGFGYSAANNGGDGYQGIVLLLVPKT